MKEKTRVLIGVILLVVLVAFTFVINYLLTRKDEKNLILSLNPELQRAMTYEQFEDGDEDIEGTDNVKFSAFFLRDLDGDGYAEKIKGTCKEIGSEDTLYMEIIVQSEGYLKNGKIQINGKNFYLLTSLPKDNELKNNYVGINTKNIEFENLNNGIQKLITGFVRAGDYSHNDKKYAAIGKNINNYSRDDNKITFTGTYVNGEGIETEIVKEINFSMDWYGTTSASIKQQNQNYYDIEDRIDEENGLFVTTFMVYTSETKDQLIISSNTIRGTIPEFNGYEPISVTLKSGTGDFSYDEETREFTIIKTAVVNENGDITTSLAREGGITIQVTYPLDAYNSQGDEEVTLKIPVSTNYAGYNNPNVEFENPFVSNNAATTLVINYYQDQGDSSDFGVSVGKSIASPNRHNFVSKIKPLNIYNNVSSEEKDDTYVVLWKAYIGKDETPRGITLKETKNNEQQKSDSFIKNDSTEDSMEEITTNVGIYFENATEFLGESGEINVYDEDTEMLIHTFTVSDWNKYSSSNPYKYSTPVKHIKIITSDAQQNSIIRIYNVKNIDDDKIVSTYTREEFDKLEYIQSNLVAYLGNDYLGAKHSQAKYEEPYSISNISINKNMLSTQNTEKGVNITIDTIVNEENNQMRWANGIFLLKLPDEILNVKINNVSINENSVKISSYEVIENGNGKFIKIKTSNVNPREYSITINSDITPDPRVAGGTKQITLYAKNENIDNYHYSGADIYDIDEDENLAEFVNVRSTNITLVAPNSLIANQTMSEYDNSGDVKVSPEIAEINAIYNNGSLQEQSVKIGVQLKNNYSGTISEILVLGKIPFEGNTYVLSGGDLKSEYSTTMINTGIEVPAELEGKVKVYYSTNENPSKDLNNNSNGWTLKENVSDWLRIKTWLIDFEDTILDIGDEYAFYYKVMVPIGIDFNEVAYSHYGVYFSLDTNEGKYRTQVEPNKIGVRRVYLYNLGINKYQKDINKKVEGATYLVSRLDDEGNLEESQSAKTNTLGSLVISNIYAEKIYEIKEIGSPKDYELNEDVIKIIAHVNEENDTLTIEKIEGEIKGEIQLSKPEGENYQAIISVEDEVKAKLTLTKYEENTQTKIAGVKYRIKGQGFPDSGKVITTDSNGEIVVEGLIIGEEYILEETKAEGYYLNEPLAFKVINDEGDYELSVTAGTVKNSEISTIDDSPVVVIEAEDAKIPTYDLEITKIKHVVEVESGGQGSGEVTYLQGAKFKLYKGDKEIGKYETDSNGKIVINDLFVYDEDKDADQTYVLKEVASPDGHTKIKDIVFKVKMNNEGILEFIEDSASEGQNEKRYTSDGSRVNLIVEDNPTFKLIKKDSETDELLPSTKFAIFNVSEGERPATNSKGEIIGTKETINGKEYYVVETDANGEIAIDLPEGQYKAIEVEADDKYDLSEAIYYFGIGGSVELEERISPSVVMQIGGTADEKLISLFRTADGGHVVLASLGSKKIKFGDTLFEKEAGDKTIIKFDENENVEWIMPIACGGGLNINSACLTSDGGIVLVGDTYGTYIKIGDEIITFNENHPSIVIKLNSSGELDWGTTLSTYLDLNSVDTLENGKVVVGGRVRSNITIGDYSITNINGYDGVTIIFDDSGEVDGVTSFGEKITFIKGTSDGGFVVGGELHSDLTIGEHSVEHKGNMDALIIKYDSDANVEWMKSIGGTAQDQITAFEVIENGDIVVGGRYNSTSIEIGNETITKEGSTSSFNSFLVQYSSTGEIKNITNFKTNGGFSIDSINSTSDGGYIGCGSTSISGTTNSSKTILKGFLLPNGKYLFKCDKNGEIEWAEGGFSFDIKDVKEIEEGKYISIGDFKNSLSIGESYISSNGSTDGIIIQFQFKEIEKAVYKNAILVGSENYESIYSIAETQDGGYIAAGYFSSDSINVGDDNLLNRGKNDGMVIKFSQNDKVEWARAIGGDKDDIVLSVCETADGGYIVGGEFESSSLEVGGSTLINNSTVYSSGTTYEDVFIVKYDCSGEVEWAKSFGGTWYEDLESVFPTKDGGFIAVGDFASPTMEVDDYLVTNDYGTRDAFIIKYNSIGNVEWINKVAKSVCISSVVETKDNCFIAVGDDFDNGIIVKYNAEGELQWIKKEGEIDGFCKTLICDNGDFIVAARYKYINDCVMIRYDSTGEIIWEIIIEKAFIEDIFSCKDGGFIIGAEIDQPTRLGDYILDIEEDRGGIVAKYREDGTVEWAKGLKGLTKSRPRCVIEFKDGSVVAGGASSYDSIQIRNKTITNNGLSDGLIVKIDAMKASQDTQELEVKNNRKEFIVTTDVKEIVNKKGGTISGEDEKIYEKIKYGDSNTKEIVMTPDDGYEIVGITINDKEQSFVPLPDGSYIMPILNDITENKHIVVTYAKTDNKVIINKVDSISGEELEGATIKLDQIDERNEPDQASIIGNFVDNGINYTTYRPDTENEVTSAMGELTNNGTYYFVDDGEGHLIPTNGKTWQVANVEGATKGKASTTANSYIPIDLTGLTGQYLIVVNARISSQGAYDYGYATVNTSTTAPKYNTTAGRFMSISGNDSSRNYKSDPIDGGSTYYLHLGYRKDGSTDTGEDQVVINSINVYPAVEENNTYNFVEENGVYKSTNQNSEITTTCSSYVPIDLRGYEGKYYLTINAEKNTNYGTSDAGISTDTTALDPSSSSGKIIHDSIKFDAKDFTTEIDGGDLYYLHFAFRGGSNYGSGEDTFTINSISISLSPSELYHSEEITTNSLGQAITNVPFGKYAVTELVAPDGYELLNSSEIIEFRNSDNNEFTIQDRRIAKVIVHHYKKGTTEKIAEDEIVYGSQGDYYSTSPKVDLNKYRLEVVNDEEVLPDNRTGQFTYDDIEVTYYYVEREIPLTVHHFVEGTTDNVPLADGTYAEDIEDEGIEGDPYTTSAIDSELLDSKYELLDIPDNANGIYEYDDVNVTYYYKVKDSLGYVVHHVNKETGEKIADDVVVNGGKYGDTYTTNQSYSIPVNYYYDSKTDNWEGTLVDNLTEVTYYYLMLSSINNVDVVKSSNTTLISENNQVVDYSLEYLAETDEYIGKIKVKIVDELPYEIDESLSNIDGGTYNNADRTITWEDTYIGINTYENGLFTINPIKNISVVYKDIDLSAEVLSNTGVGYLTTYIDGEEQEITFREDLDIPQEIKGKVIVKYVDKKTNEEIAEEVVHSARIGTSFDVSDDSKEIIGYVLSEEPDDKTGTYTEADQVRIYKYSKKMNYNVEYYYGGVKDDSKTETIEGVEGSTIEKYPDKVIDGYKVDRTENLPITLDSSTENLIKVYYEKDNFDYRVEYYYSGVKDDSKTATNSALFESVIDTYEDKVIEGYTFDKTEGLPLTITSNSDNNVIKVYYKKDNFSYSVEYYFDEVKDNSLTEVASAEFESRVENYIDKVKPGYIYSRSEHLPLVITADPTQNIIKIYYITDDGQTKEIFYFIEYYKDGVKVESDTEKVTNVVQLLADETLIVNPDGINTTDKYLGYRFDRTDPSVIPNTIDSGETIKVYYVRRNDLPFSIRYLDKQSLEEIKESTSGQGTYQEEVQASDYAVDISGYTFDSADKNVLTIDLENNVINLYYTKRNDLSYKVRYFDKDTNEEISDEKIVYDRTYLEVINTANEVVDISGYNYDSASTDSITIGVDTSLNVIDLFYTKRNDLSYIVKYVDKDTGDEITPRKTVGDKTLGDVIYSRDEIISINKYDYDSVSDESITIAADNNEITIFYIKKNGRVIAKYVDDISGEEISTADSISGKLDTNYSIHEKDINGYVYIRNSGNTEGTYSEEVPEIILYYKKVANVIVRYVDKNTEEEISSRDNISGYVGKEYKATFKDIPGYVFFENSDNTEGIMTEDPIEVTYYYIKQNKVIVNYIDSQTDELIDTEEKTYIEGNIYTITPKEIAEYDIDESRNPDNSSGIIGKEDIVVNYYYKEKAALIIEYVDNNGNKLIDNTIKNTHIGETYEVEKVLIDGYNFRGMPDNYKGIIEKKETKVTLIYDKVDEDNSKADNTIPKTMDKNMTKIYIGISIIGIILINLIVGVNWIKNKKDKM